MLQNAYFFAKIGADTAEDEQHFAEILPTDAIRRAGEELRRVPRLPRRAAAVEGPRDRPPWPAKRQSIHCTCKSDGQTLAFDWNRSPGALLLSL